MTHAEKYLYHQIHPLKLLTDFGTSFASTWLLWEGRWGSAALVALVPSLLASLLLMRLVDLHRYARTPLGRYVARFMNRRVEALRLSGQALMWVGAAVRLPWLIPLGFSVIMFAWLNGLWSPTGSASDS